MTSPATARLALHILCHARLVLAVHTPGPHPLHVTCSNTLLFVKLFSAASFIPSSASFALCATPSNLSLHSLSSLSLASNSFNHFSLFSAAFLSSTAASNRFRFNLSSL